MERAQYTVTIDIINTGTVRTNIRLKQGDYGAPLYIKVENNGNPYYDENIIPEVYFKRPDRTTVFGSALKGNDNKYIYIFKGSELEVAGNVLADVKFKHPNGRESTATFMFECVVDTRSNSLQQSKVIWNDVIDTLDKFEKLVDESEEIVTDVTTHAKVAESASESAENAADTAEKSAIAAELAASNASISESNAKTAADEAKNSEKITLESANETVQLANSAAASALTASTKASEAEASATMSVEKATEASNYAVEAESYAHGSTGKRENEDADNSKYYYEQTKKISQGINGIMPMGTITFEELPTSDIANNAMYNISNSFTSDERFNDGGGVFYGPGNNVIWTAEGKWDVTASSNVTGIKGKREKEYRQGNVNITPEDIGAVEIEGDTANNIVLFESGDSTEAESWTDIDMIKSGENHSSLFNKLSTMFKNVRYLFKKLGTTDISKIGGGTVTGATETLKEMASKMWIIPTNYTSVFYKVIYGIGEPDNTKYSPYDHFSINDLYIDIANGNIYQVKDTSTDVNNPGQYEWVLTESLRSVNDSILSTISDCAASTTATDIAGASALAELNDSFTPEFINAGTSIEATIPSSSNTSTVVRSLTLTPGLWYVDCAVRWSESNTNGIRTIFLKNNDTQSANNHANHTNTLNSLLSNIVGNNTTFVTQTMSGLIRVTKDTTFYLHVSQNSGSELNTEYNFISAYKITDNVI